MSMSNNFKDYTETHSDWRKTLRQNNNRTRVVIVLFFLIYAAIGLLVDMFLHSSAFSQATIPELFFGLITLQIFPLATLVMIAIAAISIYISFMMYDKLMLLGTEYHEVKPETVQNPVEQRLYNIVEEMKVAAGMRYMPKVYIIDADYMNAFASGYSEKSAMIAITRGLMEKLNRDELQAVVAHELSHIRHLDIKLTMMASLLANMMIIILDVFFYNAMFSRRGDTVEGRSRNVLSGFIILLRYLLPLITALLLLYLSRKRELMADAGCVELMRDNRPLASALIKISDDHHQNHAQYNAEYQHTPHENVRREAYIFDPRRAGFLDITSITDLFSTHPSLEQRLAALGFKKEKKTNGA